MTCVIWEVFHSESQEAIVACRLLFLMAPGVDAISSADCWVWNLSNDEFPVEPWVPLDGTDPFPPRLEVGLLKFVAAHLVLKEIHFAGIPLPTQ